MISPLSLCLACPAAPFALDRVQQCLCGWNLAPQFQLALC
jgi:hypothetical protein